VRVDAVHLGGFDDGVDAGGALAAGIGAGEQIVLSAEYTSVYVVTTFEQTGRVALVQRRPDLTDPVATVRATLEAAGVEFTDGDAPGVRLRRADP